jgi:hypothetical protein
MRKEGAIVKRLIAPAALILVVGLGTYTIFAQQGQPSDQPQQGRMGGGMMQQGGGMQDGTQGGMMQQQGRMAGRGMMQQGPMPCPACAAMMHETVTPTSDGGLVVAVAGKLIKYDAGLNKVRETNIDIDWTKVHQMAQQMMQNCPIHGRRMPQPQPQGQRQPQWQGQQTP